jgi:hypothetical protein
MNGVTTSETGLSTRRAILQGTLAIALLAAAPPGARAQQKAEKLLVQYEDKPKGEQQQGVRLGPSHSTPSLRRYLRSGATDLHRAVVSSEIPLHHPEEGNVAVGTI